MVPTSLGLLIVLLGLSIPVGAALLLLALSLGAAFSPMPIIWPWAR